MKVRVTAVVVKNRITQEERYVNLDEIVEFKKSLFFTNEYLIRRKVAKISSGWEEVTNVTWEEVKEEVKKE